MLSEIFLHNITGEIDSTRASLWAKCKKISNKNIIKNNESQKLEIEETWDPLSNYWLVAFQKRLDNDKGPISNK